MGHEATDFQRSENSRITWKGLAERAIELLRILELQHPGLSHSFLHEIESRHSILVLKDARTLSPYAGQEMAWEAEWRSDPKNAPYGEYVLTFGQGGIAIKRLDDQGNWRGGRGGDLGRHVCEPSHWMLLPDPPFAAVGISAPSVGRAGDPRGAASEGLAGAI